jgi:hypothetical protein
MKKIEILMIFVAALVGLLGAVGCRAVRKPTVSASPNRSVYDGFEAKIPPRVRMASYASSTVGTSFLGPEQLGTHGYRRNWSEKNGIVYTCKAGHIDIAHLRKVADWTAFLAAKSFRQIKKNKTEFSFKLKEGSLYFVRLTYPENWKDLSRKDKEHIGYEISVGLGQYFAYVASVWHEILTWFGYKATGIYSEFPSAFSWEDVLSNLLGTYIGALALRDTEHSFNEAVTLALERELEKLDVQPGEVARRAAESVRGLWFSDDFIFFVGMKKRNFDIGLDDGFVTPWIVSSICECEGVEGQIFLAPNPGFLAEYGFSMKFEIEPREWEKDKILKIVYPDGQARKRLEPAVHFPQIMDYIKKEAVEKYGRGVGLYYSR